MATQDLKPITGNVTTPSGATVNASTGALVTPPVEPSINAAGLSTTPSTLNLATRPVASTFDINTLIPAAPTVTTPTTGTGAPTPTGQTTTTTTTPTAPSMVDRLSTLLGQSKGKAVDLATAVDEATAPYAKQLNEINTQIGVHKADALLRQENALNSGETQRFAVGEAQRIGRTDDIEALRLSAIAEGMRGNIALAERQAQRMIDAKYADIDRNIETAKTNIYNNYDSLTPAQKKQADATLLRLDAQDAFVKQKKEDDKITQGFIQEAISQSQKNGKPIDTLTLKRANEAQTPTEALKILAPFMEDAALKEKALLDRQLTLSQIAKNNADAGKTNAETRALGVGSGGGNSINVPGVGVVNANAAALAQAYANDGKLPTPADLKAAGTNFAEVTRIAKEMPKPDGALVSLNTGIKPEGLGAKETEAITALSEIVRQTLPDLKDRFGKLNAGLLGRAGAAIYTSQDRQDYRTFRADFLAKLLVARSGGAVTEQEYQRYSDMVPTEMGNYLLGGISNRGGKTLNSLESSMKKTLDNKLATNQLGIYGYSKVKIGDQQYTAGDVVENSLGKYRVNADGTLTQVQ